MNKMVQSLLNAPFIGAALSHKGASVFGLLGITISLADFPLWFRVVAGIIGLFILVTVALIQYEKWREKRADRLNSSDARDIKKDLQKKADTIKGVTEDDIQDAFRQTINE